MRTTVLCSVTFRNSAFCLYSIYVSRVIHTISSDFLSLKSIHYLWFVMKADCVYVRCELNTLIMCTYTFDINVTV